jgi:D-alanyl-lipoteichoic acid acyltransferase DltB (MBOAT superfamily)
MTNFRMPYFSRSIGEFWKRWHISLSTWFKDYLYIPLGGNRVVISRIYFNLLVVFIISGVWHGANWTFVLWGALNGLYLIAELIFNRYKPSWWLIKSNATITFILTCVAWVFFRAASVSDAFLLFKNMTNITHPFFSDKQTLVYGFFGLVFLLAVEYKMDKRNSNLPFQTKKNWLDQSLYASLIILILIMGVFDGDQFIYFQF